MCKLWHTIVKAVGRRILQPTRQTHISERHAEENDKIILAVFQPEIEEISFGTSVSSFHVFLCAPFLLSHLLVMTIVCSLFFLAFVYVSIVCMHHNMFINEALSFSSLLNLHRWPCRIGNNKWAPLRFMNV